MARREHSCGILYDATDATPKQIIVTGGINSYSNVTNPDTFLNSTEYLDLSNYKVGWRKGPNLEIGIRKVPMLEAPDTGSVYLVGALKDSEFLVYRLNDVESGWTARKSMPKIIRDGHVALFLPTELLSDCSTFVHFEL